MFERERVRGGVELEFIPSEIFRIFRFIVSHDKSVIVSPCYDVFIRLYNRKISKIDKNIYKWL